MVTRYYYLFLVLFGLVNGQSSAQTLDFTATSSFILADSESVKKEKCNKGFESQIQLLFGRSYKVIGKYPDLRVMAVPVDSPVKIIETGEIKYDPNTNFCTSKLKLEVPTSFSIPKLTETEKEDGFKNDTTAVFQFTKKLEKDSLYLSYLSCFNPPEIFHDLINSAISDEMKAKTPRISLTYLPETFFTSCALIKNETCKCTMVIKKDNLKQEIVKKFGN